MYDTSQTSPNKAPRTKPISLILLHATVGSYASALAWLTNPRSGVSTHYLISKLGHVAQLVPDDFVAWHAGRARWRGETDVNGISIGVELENANDGHDPYPRPQLDALTALTRDLLSRHHLSASDITRHLDVAVPAGRKTDPAGFPLAAFLAGLARYRARGVPVYQSPSLGGPLWGYLAQGEIVTIDATYPDGAAHLSDGRGFVRLSDLERL